MSTSIPAPNASSPAWWEFLWRTGGIQSALCFVIAWFISGHLPAAAASSDTLAAFYEDGRGRILVAAIFTGFGVINLMWFASALKATLTDEGEDGWGASAVVSSAVVGGLFLLLLTLVTGLAYSRDSASGVHHFVWPGFVLSSFPRAMLIMSGSFGLWRAKQISNALFGAGVACVVLVLLGATTWASHGFWAPDGAYSRVISPLIGLVWLAVASAVLYARTPATRAAW
jgi:hypothetical protein